MESPQTSVVPGSVKPCSGPIMWTIPCLVSLIGKNGTENFTILKSVSTCSFDSKSEIPFARFFVGTLWSGTANVKSGLLTNLSFFFRPSKACGLVTSWIRCLSI